MKSVLFVLLALFSASSLQAQDAATRLQEALSLERSVGDYEGAIAIYREIAADAASDRRVVGEAMLHLGKAYESLGRTEAFAAYERVARDFGDQEDLVAEARERMRGLAVETAESEPEYELVGPLGIIKDMVEWYTLYTALSPDGTEFMGAFGLGSESRQAIQRLGTTDVEWLGESFSQGRFIPGRNEVASLNWAPTEKGDFTFNIWNRDTGESRVWITYETLQPYVWAEIYDFTSDGSAALLAMGPTRNTYVMDFALVDLDTGEIRRSVRMDHETNWWGTAPCLLEDRYVLYNRAMLEDQRIRRLDLETGANEFFLDAETESQLLGCSKERGAVMLKTNEFGQYEARVYRTENAKPVSGYSSLPGIHTDARGIGVTEEGLFVYDLGNAASKRVSRIYDFDLANLEVVPGGEQAPRAMLGPNIGWDRTGSRFAAGVSRREVRIIEDGTSRTAQIPPYAPVIGYRWTPDGTQFTAASTQDERKQTYWIDPETLVPVDSIEGVAAYPGRAGQSVMALRIDEPGQACLDEYEPGSTDATELVCFAFEETETGNTFESTPEPMLSPDGRRVVFGRVQWHFGSESGLLVVDLDTGETTFLASGDYKYLRQPAWLPDSDGLLARYQAGRLVRVGLDGTFTPVAESFTETRFVQQIRLHPDGSRVHITSDRRDTREQGNPTGPFYRVAERVWDVIDEQN